MVPPAKGFVKKGFVKKIRFHDPVKLVALFGTEKIEENWFTLGILKMGKNSFYQTIRFH